MKKYTSLINNLNILFVLLTSPLMIQADSPVSERQGLYESINAKWLKEINIPNDKPGISNFDILQEEIHDELRRLFEDTANSEMQDRDLRKVQALYRSFTNIKLRNELGITPIIKNLDEIDDLSTHYDVAMHFAKFLEMGITSPLVWMTGPDFKNSSAYLYWVSQSGLGLPARSMYLEQDERSKKFRNSYLEHLNALFSLAGFDDSERIVKEVMKLETELASIQLSPEETRDIQKSYNVRNVAEVEAVLSNLPVRDILDFFNISESARLNVSEVPYIAAFNNLFKFYSVDAWKNYLKARLLFSYANILDTNFHEADVNYQKALGLIAEDSPIWLRAVRAVETAVPMLVGKLYVEKYFDNNKKQQVQELVQEIKTSAKEVLGRSTRLNEETRKRALKKLDQMTFNIGYPEKWRDFSKFEFDQSDLVGNIKKAFKLDLEFQNKKLGNAVDREEWDRSPHEVNAFYDPTKNKFVLLAGILKPPFYDSSAGDAILYGGLGFVVGHEIGHAFDDNGSQFDELGNLNNWWSDDDRKRFEMAKLSYIQQANKFQILPGMYLKGDVEIGEIIGDATGAKLSLHALDKVISSKNLDRKSTYQKFYQQLAVVWREKYRPDFQSLLIETDAHPPGKFRTDGIVKNMDTFHEAFDTKPGDRMYLDPARRIKLW